MKIRWCAQLVLLTVVGCAQPATPVNLRSVLDEASKSDLEPTARLRGVKLRVGGVVESRGLKKQSEVRATYGWHEAHTERTRAQFPFVVLTPGDDKPGRALCFFEMSDIDEIAKLAPGDVVQFNAKLQELVRKDNQEILVLHCSTFAKQSTRLGSRSSCRAELLG